MITTIISMSSLTFSSLRHVTGNAEICYSRLKQTFYVKLHLYTFLQDSATGITPVPEYLQTYEAFLGETQDKIMEVRKCPVAKMTLCVTSDEEKAKCVKMSVSDWSRDWRN